MMNIIAYIILVTVMIVLLGCLVPVIQLIIYKFNDKKHYSYIFPTVLFNREYRCGDDKNDLSSRMLLSTRGWIRGANGEVMTNASFEEKKLTEYKIDLP